MICWSFVECNRN